MSAAMKADALDVSIVVPAYNEEQRLEPTIDRLVRYLRTRAWRWEIVVVDDGSGDGTLALARRLGERAPGLRVIATAPNRGKGHAVRVGMLAATGAARVMYDADGSTPPEELPKLLAPLAAGAAVAIGSRYLRAGGAAGQPWWRRAWSRLANLVVRHTLVPGVLDTQCGFKAFTAAAARRLFGRATVDGWAFDLEVLALARQAGMSVIEVAVAWTDDGRSRVRPWRDLAAVVREAAAIKRRLVA